MAIKKSDLYGALWKSCDELRGGMDASQYKDYVLVLLFVKYVSDKYAGRKGAIFEVPEGASFTDMVALKGKSDIGERINKLLAALAEPNDLRGVIDVVDFNDPEKLGRGKEMVDRLSKLVAIFDKPELDFRGNRAEGDDLLGDAYEYLMRHFATESGKSKGQFYTPAEVSRVMAQVIGLAEAKSANQSVYDPTCGSGSLLLKAHDEAQAATGVKISVFGQENDNATYALARMNMILHDCPTAEVWKGNTLASPHFTQGDGLKTFDWVVANPPFSTKAWTTGFDPTHDEFGRFKVGQPPAKNGDFAFLLHVIASLKSSGKGAIILPHGVLFRGGAEANIRRALVRQGVIRGIIGLPPNLFYGTGIPACIIVLDKEHAASRKGIFLIDASKGFVKDGNKNRLRAQDIHRIVDSFNNQKETPRYARLVPLSEVEANNFNLNLPRYVDSSEPEDLHDLEAHLRGGIPNRDVEDLERYWAVLAGVKDALFDSARRPGYSELRVSANQVNSLIISHPEFNAFQRLVTKFYDAWQTAETPHLREIAVGHAPNTLIGTLSESFLDVFRPLPLVDAYDMYQHLMDYWDATMQDDVYQLVQDGWQAVTNAGPNYDLIPPGIVVRRYFAAEATAIEALEADRDALAARIEELDEEHGGEDGLLSEAKTEKGKLTAKTVKDRLKACKGDPSATDEREVLEVLLEVMELEAAASKRVKEALKVLDAKVATQYERLTEAEVKDLVVDDKWLASISAAVSGELRRVSETLNRRIGVLGNRYSNPLPSLACTAAALADRVENHLALMGAGR